MVQHKLQGCTANIPSRLSNRPSSTGWETLKCVLGLASSQNTFSGKLSRRHSVETMSHLSGPFVLNKTPKHLNSSPWAGAPYLLKDGNLL